MTNPQMRGPNSSAYLPTPHLLYNRPQILEAANILRRNAGLAKILYSTKACGLMKLIDDLGCVVDGFSVSSPHELSIASLCSSAPRYAHLTSPGLVPEWLASPVIPSHISFNSLGQFERCRAAADDCTSLGIRVNPGVSETRDDRYNSCRRFSKLGVGMSQFVNRFADDLGPIRGVHIHNSCLSESWQPLMTTVSVIMERLKFLLPRLEWINLGGGYLWNDTTDFRPLQRCVELLTLRFGLDVFIEPGAGFVNRFGRLVASVTDMFESDGKHIAVLDTTVNHLPEVFEYQFEPDISEHREGAKYEYILVGCTCLAGDVFGEYAFDEPLQIASRVTFENVGAYTLVKAHPFNGIDLPSVYALNDTDQLELIKEFTFDDFASRCGLTSHEYANH